MQQQWLRRSWFILPVLISLIILAVAPKMKSPPEKVGVSERAVKVRVIDAPSLPIVPRALGYGTTKAARTWEAVAEVAGQVAWTSDELKSGKLIDQGTELLRVDEASYRLALTQAETQLSALEVKDRTTRASLALEERGQALLRTDIERKRKLKQQGTLSASVLEEAERGLLKGEVLVQNLKNILALCCGGAGGTQYPNGQCGTRSSWLCVVAEREVLNTQTANAELDLQRTRFVAPFDLRITDRKVNQAQYAYKRQLLFSADGLEAVEFEARFPIGKLRPLLTGENSADNDAGVSVAERAPDALNLDALVRLKTATHTVEWEARVDRVAGVIDPQTQSIGVVVVVDKPYEQARPGQRPPLV